MNDDGSRQTQLTRSTGDDGHPAWSPDGRALAFSSQRVGPKSDLYVMWADGRQPTRLTTDKASDGGPTWGR